MLRLPRSGRDSSGSDVSRITVPTPGAVGGLCVGATLASAAGSGTSPCSNRKKLTFARLATCILNVGRTRKKTVNTKSRAREEELLQAAENGDVTRLRALVLGRDLNFESTDQLGRTPLHLAVVNDHKEAVKFLLDYVDCRRVYQALLSAINLGNEEIAEMIIEHPKYEEISADLNRHGKSFFYQNKFNDDNQFSEEITPLILAAQQNRFEVVMALLLKQETIEKPHRCHCPCNDCVEQASHDELKFARSRLNAYRALSSEAYISLSSDDPILTSFRLRRELQQVADEEKYYAAEYSALANKLSEYVVRLLDKVHGNDELNAILNAGGSDDDGCPCRAIGELARLQLAIECKEKKFVAHPSCQKKLTTLWYGDFYKLLKRRSTFVQTSIVIAMVLLYPLLAVAYVFAPNSTISKLLTAPCVKFVAQATSYLFFLCLILVHGQVEQTKLCLARVEDLRLPFNIVSIELQQLAANESRDNMTVALKDVGRMCIRNHKPAIMEICIVLWITGLLWHASKQIYRIGFRAHFIDIYNAMDFFMLKFYIASLVLRRLTDLMVQASLEHFQLESSWVKLVAGQPETVYRMYWLNADRFFWDAWDPVHVCEALFAVGNILNFARLFHLLAINEHLGPMLISLERMIKDVMKFMVTFVPIFLAFMVGMYNLYWYYDPSVRDQVEVVKHHIHTNAQDGFGNLEYTFRTIFWALFGLKDAKTVELGKGFHSRFTESVGYIVFGVYNWGAVIVLLNMLIAMMTRSFDKIATDQDIEWKFVRSKLYMEYIREGSALPVPFNVIPTPASIANIIASCAASLRHCRVQWSRSRSHRNRHGGSGGVDSSGKSATTAGSRRSQNSADENSPIYNGLFPSMNSLPMSRYNEDEGRSTIIYAAAPDKTTAIGRSFLTSSPSPVVEIRQQEEPVTSSTSLAAVEGQQSPSPLISAPSVIRLAANRPSPAVSTCNLAPTVGPGTTNRRTTSPSSSSSGSALVGETTLSSRTSLPHLSCPPSSALSRLAWRNSRKPQLHQQKSFSAGGSSGGVAKSEMVSSNISASGAGGGSERSDGVSAFLRSRTTDVSVETTIGGIDMEESRPIIKTVVRRYIFERLLSSVVPNEGMNELESIQQTTAAINEGVNSFFPKMADQFEATFRQIVDIQKSISDIQRNLASFTTSAARANSADDRSSPRDRDVNVTTTTCSFTAGFASDVIDRQSTSRRCDNNNEIPNTSRPQTRQCIISTSSETEAVAQELPRRVKTVALSSSRATVCGGSTTHQLQRQNATVGLSVTTNTDDNGSAMTSPDHGNGNTSSVWQLTPLKSLSSYPVLTIPQSAAARLTCSNGGGGENCDTMYTFSI